MTPAFQQDGVTMYHGDCLDVLRELPAESVHCVVTSPPYWGLRSYLDDGHDDKHQELGLEATPDEFVQKMVEVFREVRRILRSDGTLWLNFASSYAASTIFSQRYRMRKDLSQAEVAHAAMEMFGVRVGGSEEAGEGAMPEVLPASSKDGAEQGGPRISSEGVTALLPAEPSEGIAENGGAAACPEVGSSRSVGRGVRLLRGEDPGVPDGGSHQRRRGGSSQEAVREDAGEFCKGLQGDPPRGIPTRSVPGAVLQLQLCDRVLGILSSHTFAEDEIPAAAQSYFSRDVAFKPKDEINTPHLVAMALQADGWTLRQTIIWDKPAPMPESVRDRCTKSFEYIFLLTKSARYFYDAEAVREPHAEPWRGKGEADTPNKRDDQEVAGWALKTGVRQYNPAGRNRRSVWTVSTQPYPGAHFATFPPKLIEPCILAGTSAEGCCAECGAPWRRVCARNDVDQKANEVISHDGVPGLSKGSSHDRVRSLSGATYQHVRGTTTGWQPTCTCNAAKTPCTCNAAKTPCTVLDPFLGSGTTAAVAQANGCHCIGIELSAEYLDLAKKRFTQRRLF